MNDNLLITNESEFESVILSLEGSLKNIKDIFARERKNAQDIDGTDTWSGPAQVAFSNKYDQLMANFGPIEYSLELYIKFLKKTLEDYRLLIKAQEANLEEHAVELDVNN